MRSEGWSSHESSTRSASWCSRSRPGPLTAAVTRALGREPVMSVEVSFRGGRRPWASPHAAARWIVRRHREERASAERVQDRQHRAAWAWRVSPASRREGPLDAPAHQALEKTANGAPVYVPVTLQTPLPVVHNHRTTPVPTDTVGSVPQMTTALESRGCQGRRGSRCQRWRVPPIAQTDAASLRMASITTSGFESMATWLLATSYVVASIRFATKRSSSGFTVWSSVPTMYAHGFDFQAAPGIF